MAANTKFATINTSGSLKPTFPGLPVSEVYCERENCYAGVENYFNANDASFSFNTYAHGATATCNITTSHKFISHAFFKVKISGQVQTTNTANAGAIGPFTPYQAQIVAPSLFEYIQYQMPGMEKQIFHPGSLMTKYFDQCEGSQKRQIMCELFGNYDSVGHSNEATLQTRDVVHHLYFPVPIHSESMYTGNKEAKPHPNYMLDTQPLVIQVKFAKASDFWGTNANNSTGRAYSHITFKNFQIDDVSVVVQYGTMQSASEYLNQIYKYPCDIPYNQQYIIARGPVAVANKYRVVLLGTRSGEITQVVLRLGSDTPFSRLRGYRLRDITLRFANYNMWEAPDGTVDYYNILNAETVTSVDVSRADTQKLSITTAGRVHWFVVPIAKRTVAVKGPHNYEMGADFNNAELILEFTIHPEDDTQSMLQDDNLKLSVDFYMTSVIQFNGQTATLIQ